MGFFCCELPQRGNVSDRQTWLKYLERSSRKPGIPLECKISRSAEFGHHPKLRSRHRLNAQGFEARGRKNRRGIVERGKQIVWNYEARKQRLEINQGRLRNHRPYHYLKLRRGRGCLSLRKGRLLPGLRRWRGQGVRKGKRRDHEDPFQRHGLDCRQGLPPFGPLPRATAVPRDQLTNTV